MRIVTFLPARWRPLSADLSEQVDIEEINSQSPDRRTEKCARFLERLARALLEDRLWGFTLSTPTLFIKEIDFVVKGKIAVLHDLFIFIDRRCLSLYRWMQICKYNQVAFTKN